MRPIKLNNARLGTLLSSLTKIVFDDATIQKHVTRAKPRTDKLISDLYAVSDEYLAKAQTLPLREFGYPRALLGLGSSAGNSPENYEMFQPLDNHIKKIGTYLGTPVNALTMVYPDKGYIGWHHNGNAPGYNILMSYSQDGDGRFKYWDTVEKKIVSIEDSPGWTVKVGYYPSERTETNRVYWHAAETSKQRISIAYIMNHRDMWQSMIEEISGGDYDRDFVLSQGNPSK